MKLTVFNINFKSFLSELLSVMELEIFGGSVSGAAASRHSKFLKGKKNPTTRA